MSVYELPEYLTSGLYSRSTTTRAVCSSETCSGQGCVNCETACESDGCQTCMCVYESGQSGEGTCGQCYQDCYQGCSEHCSQYCNSETCSGQGCVDCESSCESDGCQSCMCVYETGQCTYQCTGQSCSESCSQTCGQDCYEEPDACWQECVSEICSGQGCVSCETNCEFDGCQVCMCVYETGQCGECAEGCYQNECQESCYECNQKPSENRPDYWSWHSSNGSATASQTAAAYKAVRNGGRTKNFNYLVWNDLVDKIYEVRGAAGYTWNTRFASYAATRMTASDKTLTATRFNSARYNIGVLVSTGIQEKETGDDVIGSYFLTISNCINLFIDSLEE